MKYGVLTYNPENNDVPLTGKIACRMITASIQLRAEKKSNPNAPDFSVWAKENGAPYQLGSGWKKKMEKGGELISLTLDSPDFAAPLNVTAFPVSGDPSQFDVVWQRPRQDRKAVDTAE